MKDSYDLLVYLAEKGAVYREIEISTIAIAKDNDSSQQSISRKLIELEAQHIIDRQVSVRGIKIRITETGISMLKKLHIKLKQIFEDKISVLKGTVESGFGEGAYYLGQKQYQEQFNKKLGFIPFKGTLNIRIDYPTFLKFISTMQKLTIESFKAQGRTFGSIICYKIKLNGIQSAIIIPERTSHPKDIIEIISETNFRQKLNLKDNDIVKISE